MNSLKRFLKGDDKMQEGSKLEASLSDQNANMAPISANHPFLEGCKDRPLDRDGEVDQLRQWVKKQPHLPPLTDNHLLLFLHSNYYKQEATQDAIEVYYSIRTTSPELFRNKGIYGSVSHVWDLSNMVSLPGTTPEGYNVLMYRLTDFDASKLTFNEAMKTFFLFNDIRLSEDGLSPGYIVIFDMKGINLGHLARINLSSIRKFMNYIQFIKGFHGILRGIYFSVAPAVLTICKTVWYLRGHSVNSSECPRGRQEGHPARLKGVHVINSVSFMDRVLALVRPLMKSGLIKMLTIHGSDLTNLYSIVPQGLFPVEYGGKVESIQKLHDAHRKLIQAKYEKWAEEEELFLMDMNKRPKVHKKPCFITSSFKSLSID